MLQYETAPCVLCGAPETQVHPVSPCGHLVCRVCFDGSDYSGCPICHRRIDADDPFLRPTKREQRHAAKRHPDAQRLRLQLLQLGTDLHTDVYGELTGLLTRSTALSPGDATELEALLATRSRDGLTWLPEHISARETKARVLAWLTTEPTTLRQVLSEVTKRVDTGTDVLRLLVARSGGNPGLVDVPRFTAVPRPLRRALLGMLDGLDPAMLIDDIHRYPRMWVRAAEKLHPFEYVRTWPTAAAAFAALRGTRLTDPVLMQAIGRRRPSPAIREAGDRLVASTWNAQVEAALSAGDVTATLELLRLRPGELIRRVDHLLRVETDPQRTTVLDALPEATRNASTAVLVSALGALRIRDKGQRTRVYFPKGGTAKVHVVADERSPLPARPVARVTQILTAELIRRAAALPPVGVAVIDAALDTMPVPFTERTASRTLHTVPRGTVVDVPAGNRMRLFLHWMQENTGPRVDLDLSIAVYDKWWQHVDTCDYTRLSACRGAARHSGDLTSAPRPLGASEFVDLELDQLKSVGGQHLVATVFSYNDVAFENMAEAFAGYMLLPDRHEPTEVFDPGSVRQRFDLTGDARAMVPMSIDLASRQMRWLDVTAGVTGTDHNMFRHADALANMCMSLEAMYQSGMRVSLDELARWHAAARADTVLVRENDGALLRFVRRYGESDGSFAYRIGTGVEGSDGGGTPREAATAKLQILLDGDLTVPAGATVFAAHRADLDPAHVKLVTAAELTSTLES